MADVSNATQNQVQPQQAFLTGFASAPQAPADSIQRVTAQVSSIGQLHFPDEKIKYYMSIGLSDYSPSFNVSTVGGLPVLTGGSGQVASTTVSLTDQIILPLPISLRDLQNVNYTEKGLLQEAFQIGGGLFKGVAGIAAYLTGLQSVKAGLSTGAGVLGAGELTGAAAQAYGDYLALKGIAPNQMLTIFLNGPQYKRHSFEWDLAPKTPSEARSLKNIIKLLNNSMAPSLGAGNSNGQWAGLYWTWPKIFSLSFSPNQDYLFKFKPSVLHSFAVDYAGGHVPSFLRADGITDSQNPPESVKLIMEFWEIEFWKAGDFKDLGGNANQAEINAQEIIVNTGGTP